MDIQNFIAEFKKTFVYDMLCESLEDEQLFEHTIVGNQVIWMKEQTRQMWSMWQAAIARMEVRINTLDEMLLNQGEALVQAKAQAVPEGFVLVSQKDLLDLTIAINAVDLATHTDSKTNEVREMWQQGALKLVALGKAQEQSNV